MAKSSHEQPQSEQKEVVILDKNLLELYRHTQMKPDALSSIIDYLEKDTNKLTAGAEKSENPAFFALICFNLLDSYSHMVRESSYLFALIIHKIDSEFSPPQKEQFYKNLSTYIGNESIFVPDGFADALKKQNANDLTRMFALRAFTYESEAEPVSKAMNEKIEAYKAFKAEQEAAQQSSPKTSDARTASIVGVQPVLRASVAGRAESSVSVYERGSFSQRLSVADYSPSSRPSAASTSSARSTSTGPGRQSVFQAGIDKAKQRLGLGTKKGPEHKDDAPKPKQ